MDNAQLLRMPNASSPHNIRTKGIHDTIVVVASSGITIIVERRTQESGFLNACTELVFAAAEDRNTDGGVGGLPAGQDGECLLQHPGPHETTG